MLSKLQIFEFLFLEFLLSCRNNPVKLLTHFSHFKYKILLLNCIVVPNDLNFVFFVIQFLFVSHQLFLQIRNTFIQLFALLFHGTAVIFEPSLFILQFILQYLNFLVVKCQFLEKLFFK